MVYRTCSNCGFSEDSCLCCPKCGHYDMCDCHCYYERKAAEAELKKQEDSKKYETQDHRK